MAQTVMYVTLNATTLVGEICSHNERLNYYFLERGQPGNPLHGFSNNPTHGDCPQGTPTLWGIMVTHTYVNRSDFYHFFSKPLHSWATFVKSEPHVFQSSLRYGG